MQLNSIFIVTAQFNSTIEISFELFQRTVLDVSSFSLHSLQACICIRPSLANRRGFYMERILHNLRMAHTHANVSSLPCTRNSEQKNVLLLGEDETFLPETPFVFRLLAAINPSMIFRCSNRELCVRTKGA